MTNPSAATSVVRFGIYTFHERSGELLRSGIKVRLAEQPLQVLRLLIDQAGEVVTREEIRAHLWRSDTFVSFDVGLNSAVRKLREALGDSADNPRFVETLPRRGYRFIAPVERLAASVPGPRVESPPPGRIRRTTAGAILAIVTVGALAALAFARLDPFGADPVTSADAELAYRRGLLAMGRETAAGYTTAVKYFEDAVARQPDFADAYAALATAQAQLLYVGSVPPREVVPKAEAAARRAVQLDGTLASAHHVLGEILQVYYWRWDEARAAFRRAGEARKTAVERHHRVGQGLIRDGHFDEAAAQFDLAQKADPLSPDGLIVAATLYRRAGQHDRAVGALRQAIATAPTHARAHFQLGMTLMRMERAEEAIGACQAAAEASNGNPRFEACVGIAAAAAGRVSDARRILDHLQARARREYVSSFGIAWIHDALGDKAAELSAFERAYQDRAVELSHLRDYPPFATIGSDPYYQALAGTIGAPR